MLKPKQFEDYLAAYAKQGYEQKGLQLGRLFCDDLGIVDYALLMETRYAVAVEHIRMHYVDYSPLCRSDEAPSLITR